MDKKKNTAETKGFSEPLAQEPLKNTPETSPKKKLSRAMEQALEAVEKMKLKDLH